MISDIIKKASKRLYFLVQLKEIKSSPAGYDHFFTACMYARFLRIRRNVACFRTLEFDRVLLKSEVSFTFISSKFLTFFILKHGEFRLFVNSFQVQKKHRYGRVNTNRYVSANCNIYFCCFHSLLPLFDKHIGCYCNGLIGVAEKPKILKRF